LDDSKTGTNFVLFVSIAGELGCRRSGRGVPHGDKAATVRAMRPSRNRLLWMTQGIVGGLAVQPQ
jgi:hypothetical protein